MTPITLMTLNAQFTSLMLETQTVIALRLMGITGAIPKFHGEDARMMDEKGPVMINACLAAAKATLAGNRPDQIMTAAMTPVSTQVRANRKRLMA